MVLVKKIKDRKVNIEFNKEFIKVINEKIRNQDTDFLAKSLKELLPADSADIIENLSPENRSKLIELEGFNIDPEIFIELNESIRMEIFLLLSVESIASLLKKLESDNALKILENLDKSKKETVLNRLPPKDRFLLEEGLSYPEDTAARIMQREFTAIPSNWSVGQTIDYLRDNKELPEEFLEIFIVDNEFKPIGTVPSSKVLRAARDSKMISIMSETQLSIPVDMDKEEVGNLFENYNLNSACVVDKNNKLIHYTPVPLPGPRLPHDMAFTKNYSILVDLPLFWDPELLKDNHHHARFFDNMPTRFGIIPRYGNQDDVVWFDAAPTYVLHWMNAYEEGDEVVLEGYFQDNPSPEPLPGMPKAVGQLMANIDQHSFQSRLHRWRFNLKTGETTEERLDDRILEFGSFNQQYAGSKTRYLYSTWTKPGWFLFSGLVKHDFESGESWSLPFGEERYGSEAPFAPRVNAQDEDDGYLVSFITDMKENRSECILVDAKDIEAGPVCRIILPHRICSGTHATWASGESIRQYQNNKES
mgnify:CR=1 FL=1